ncbi:MAG: hypothetical protein RSC93_07170 [Erysipelotrichaceae bacterium]
MKSTTIDFIKKHVISFVFLTVIWLSTLILKENNMISNKIMMLVDNFAWLACLDYDYRVNHKDDGTSITKTSIIFAVVSTIVILLIWQ